MITRLLAGCDAALPVKAPPYRLAAIFHFDGHGRVEGTSHNGVVADRVIPIEPNPVEMHDQRVSGPGCFYIKRTGLGVAAQHTSDPALVFASCIDRGRMDGVTGCDLQDWRIRCRELAVKNGGGKLMALGRACRTLGRAS